MHTMVKTVYFVGILFICTGCSTIAIVKPVGNVHDGVEFELYRSGASVKPSRIRLNSVSVQRKTDKWPWDLVWHTLGSRVYSTIKYGENIGKGAPRVPARALEKDQVYRINISGSTLHSHASAYAEFYFLSDGSIEVVPDNETWFNRWE